MTHAFLLVSAVVCLMGDPLMGDPVAADDADALKKYTDEEIIKIDSGLFFQRLSEPEEGYNVYAAPWALGKKCLLDPDVALAILNRATDIYYDGHNEFQRRQCLILFTESKAQVTLPIVLDALHNDDSEHVRSLAAYCIPFYGPTPRAIDSLRRALKKEQNKKVLASMKRALDRMENR